MPVLRAMSQPDYDAWLAQAVPAYASDKVASGQWAEQSSLELSQKEHDELLPHGLDTPDNHFFTIVDTEGCAVGVLWFAVKLKFNSRIAYVFDVSVRPEHQRKGHASRAFLALEDSVRSLGLSGIALHVFGHNTRAQSLYTKLGYQATNISLFKPIGPGALPSK